MRFLQYFTAETVLFGGRFSPVTDCLGFVKLPASQVASVLARKFSLFPQPFEVAVSRVDGVLEENVGLLEPFTMAEDYRFLVTQTVDPAWSMIIGNRFRGGRGPSAVDTVVREVGCEGLAVVNTRPVSNPETRYGALACSRFEYYPAGVVAGVSAPCYVQVSDQGNHRVVWDFRHSARYFDFEDVEGYKARVKTERFNPVKAAQYCRHFGLDAFSEDFYSREAYLVSAVKPWVEQRISVSLTEMRRMMGFDLLEELT